MFVLGDYEIMLFVFIVFAKLLATPSLHQSYFLTVYIFQWSKAEKALANLQPGCRMSNTFLERFVHVHVTNNKYVNAIIYSFITMRENLKQRMKYQGHLYRYGFD